MSETSQPIDDRKLRKALKEAREKLWEASGIISELLNLYSPNPDVEVK